MLHTYPLFGGDDTVCSTYPAHNPAMNPQYFDSSDTMMQAFLPHSQIPIRRSSTEIWPKT